MPSTVYKGDLAEVSFAPETGLMIRDGTDVSMVLATTGNISKITFSARQNTTLFDSDHKLLYPKNMLVGSQLIWEKTTAAIDNGDLPDTGNGGRIFTIVENNGTEIKFTPAMISGVGALGTGDTMHILPYKTPPMDKSMTHTAGGERVLTDQFLGIATALTLPETKVDLKRFHVVGLGRDAAVQVPGKLTTEGGSFEVAMHSARWLKYCLGHELINSTLASDSDDDLNGIAYAGQSHIKVTDKTPSSSNRAIVAGDYVEIRGATAVPIVSDHEPDGGTWDGALTDDMFDKALPHEVRRIIGVSSVDEILYLDEPLCYRHEDEEVVIIRRIGTVATNPVAIANGTITDPVTRILYSRTTQPSFSLEVSQRRRDIDSDQTSVDGGVGDSKELTRVFRGCKVLDWTLTTDNDAALRLSVNFNAALCYTDTGRLETPAITRYAAHRMFDDTASTDIKRLESGIGKGSQKPFMFYNGSIKLAGQQVAQVLSMTLTGQTGVQSFHTINGHFQSNDVTVPIAQQQVPFAGARNASIMVEGQTTYDMTMEIAVDDPLFYHKMRSGTEFSVSGEGVSTAPNQIRIIFEKNLTGGTAAADSEKMVILIDDYYIVEAPLGIPEDKGVVKSTLKIMPKSIKVLARDSIAKY